MRVDLALLADYASVSGDGKLSIAGVFDAIQVPGLPWAQPTMTLVLRVRVEHGEEGTHEVLIRGFDPDGAEFLPAISGSLSVDDIDLLDGMKSNLILTVAGASLAKLGHYRFDISLDERYEESVVFNVIDASTRAADRAD